MQSVRIVLRQVGIPHKGLDVESAQEASEYIEYQYLSQGYRVLETHYLGEVRGEKGGAIQGYKVMFILVRDEVPFSAATGSDHTELVVEEKKKPGRPKGS